MMSGAKEGYKHFGQEERWRSVSYWKSELHSLFLSLPLGERPTFAPVVQDVLLARVCWIGFQLIAQAAINLLAAGNAL